MEKIKDYKTVNGETPDALDAAVTAAINEGYQPYGDPYYGTFNVSTASFCQAMVMFHTERKLSTSMPALK